MTSVETVPAVMSPTSAPARGMARARTVRCVVAGFTAPPDAGKRLTDALAREARQKVSAGRGDAVNFLRDARLNWIIRRRFSSDVKHEDHHACPSGCDALVLAVRVSGPCAE